MVCSAVVLLLVLPFGLFLNRLWAAQRQYRIIHTYVPVEATVLSAQVTSFKGSKGTVHYVPEVRYQYAVEDKSYQSKNLAPLPVSGRQDWAKAIASRYQTGQSCRAFRDPRNPSRAILIRRFGFEPYFEMLEMVLVIAVGSFFALRMWATRKREPAPAEKGWFEIKPELGGRQRLLAAKVCTWAWYGLGTVPAALFFLCVPPPYDQRAVIVFIGFAMFGLIPLVLMNRYVLMCRNLDEARLLVDQPAASLGRQLRFAISQRARQKLEIGNLRVRLLCLGTKVRGRTRVKRTLYEATPVELKDHTLHAGESLECSGELILPAEQRPSGRDASGEFDQVNWEIRLDCKIAQAPDYAACFPVAVQPLAAQEAEIAARGKCRATAEVQAVDARFAGWVLTKRNMATGYLIGMFPLLGMVLGLGMMVVAYPVIFPGDKEFPRLLELSRSQAMLLFGGGGILTAAATIYGLLFPSLLNCRYIHWAARRAVSRRPDTIVRPGADSLFVDIVPRANWNRLMLENAADIGFLTVDAQRREVRFEGDKERYRIPADALLSCELEKSFYARSAKQDAPGIWLAVIRASGPAGVWEAPVAPHLISGRVISKAQQRAAQELQTKIKTLRTAAQAIG